MKANKTLIFLLGLFLGLSVTGLMGVLAYKTYKYVKKPKRYDPSREMELLKGPTITPDLKVFAASSLDRIFLDGMTLNKPTYSTKVMLSSARHEYESFQVVVHSPKKELNSLRVEVSDLVNSKTNSQLAKSNISWRKVGYVPTGEPYYPVKFIGMWPDPLMPQETVDIAKNDVQPLWLTVYIPDGTAAGDYEGKITISAQGISPQELPLSVRIYDFTLPIENNLKTAFDFYGHVTKLRYPQGEKESDIAWQARINEINEKFIIAMLKYRMNPILNIDPMSPADLGRIDRYRRFGINNFSIGRRGGTFNNNWPTDEESINALEGQYRTYAELLKLNGMLEDTYIYTWDEGEIGNPVVAKITAMIRRAHAQLKNMVCYHGFWNPDDHPDWGKDIDIWTFNIDDFKEEAMRKLQKLGIEIWMYISGPSGFGSPNLAIDFDSIDYRIVPWLCWKYDIKGFLYWCVNWWVKSDPFLSAVNTHWGQNGNGLLFYPGKDGPIASIRTELYRDGMEDYEYFRLLIKKIKQIKILKLDERFAKEIAESLTILTVDNSIAKSMFDFTKDGESLKSRRNRIAKAIEGFDSIMRGDPLVPIDQRQ